MRLLILSDLHHEQWRGYGPVIDPAQSRPDVVILAGDIHSGAHAIGWADKNFTGMPVLYVSGNHEAYEKTLEDAQQEIESACRAAGHVHYLNCGEVVWRGVRFLGATLWTDFKLFGDPVRQVAMLEAERCMNDYHCIRLATEGNRKLRAADTAQLHAHQRSWLERKLDEPFDGKTVVITHMAPSMRSIARIYETDILSAAFASNLDDLVVKADLWVHGHTHTSFDYMVDKCRVVCNPCGYRLHVGHAENPDFDPNYIVEIE